MNEPIVFDVDHIAATIRKRWPAFGAATSSVTAAFAVGLVLGVHGDEEGAKLLNAIDAMFRLHKGGNKRLKHALVEAGLVATEVQKRRMPVSSETKRKLLRAAGWQRLNYQVMNRHTGKHEPREGWIHPADADEVAQLPNNRQRNDLIARARTLQSAWGTYLREQESTV